MRSASPIPAPVGWARLIAAGQRHELYGKELPCRHLSLAIDLDQDEVLEGERSADRYYHSAARLELRNQRRRNLARRGSDENAVERCRFLPTTIAVALSRRDI